MKKIILAALAAAVVFSGCSPLPENRTESSSDKISGGFSRPADQTIVVKNTGSGSVVVTPPTAAPQTFKGNSSSDEQSTVKLPLSVALLIGGVALIVIVFAIQYARKRSAALNAGLTAADDAIARVIASIRPTERHDIIAAAESERGKLARKKP